MTRDRMADGIFAAGFALIVAGVGLWSVPLAMVVGGLVLCCIAVLFIRRSPATEPTNGTPEHTAGATS